MNMIFTKLRFLLFKLFIFSFFLFGTFACDKYDPFEEDPLSEKATELRESLIGNWYYYHEEENEQGEIFTKEITYYLFEGDSAQYDYVYEYPNHDYPDSASNVESDWDFWEEGGYYFYIGDSFAELDEPEGAYQIMEFYGDSVLLRKFYEGDSKEGMFFRK